MSGGALYFVKNPSGAGDAYQMFLRMSILDPNTIESYTGGRRYLASFIG